VAKLSSDEKRKSAGLAAKLAGVLQTDVAKLAGSIDPTKINLIVTNAFDILQGMGLASAAVGEALSNAGITTAAKVNTMKTSSLKAFRKTPRQRRAVLASILKRGKKEADLRRYLRAHPERKKAVIAALIRARKPKLATAVSKMVVAKKGHFKQSRYSRDYLDAVSLLASNNYGSWDSVEEAEEMVQQAINDHAEYMANDVRESFTEDDIKYIVEMEMFSDDLDPYNLDPPDPKIGKAIEKELAKLLGKDWKKAAGVREGEGETAAEDDPKAWVVFIEGHGVHNVDTLWEPLLKVVKKAGYKDASVEPYDDVTLTVHPDQDY
jgi:hypothetical protein